MSPLLRYQYIQPLSAARHTQPLDPSKNNDHQHRWEQLLNRWLPIWRCKIYSNFGKPADCREELGVNTSFVHRDERSGQTVSPDNIGHWHAPQQMAGFHNKGLEFGHTLCLRDLLDHMRYDSISNCKEQQQRQANRHNDSSTSTSSTSTSTSTSRASAASVAATIATSLNKPSTRTGRHQNPYLCNEAPAPALHGSISRRIVVFWTL
mmetsp:Transcript_59015/g.97878  ORF Transcript_59015/g.97878 Transcript_59015/m.97878 type:complete len:207 (-) Transcript_59015:111-731(-)